MKKLLFPVLFFLCFQAFAQTVNIQLHASGFNQPIAIETTDAPTYDDLMFIVEKGGTIKILNPDGTVNTTPFLDISSKVSTGSEQGLLDLTFHPDFGNGNLYLYVNYTDLNGDTQISRFEVDGFNPLNVLASTELPILSIPQPASNHNGGCMFFGPNGYLYIASGDGGGSPETRAQDLDLLLGKILRIDVDNPSNGNNYGIPPGNPYVGDPNALDEIWASGLRNPWRFSFDAVDGNIWIGDVGQSNIEEIDRAPITSGGLNYGWPCYEGSQAYNTNGCPSASAFEFPFAEYASDNSTNNCSITGGYVYRGTKYTDIYGLYFFADFCSGMIGTIDNSGNLIDHGDFSGSWVSFGKDNDGELYLVDIGGSIYKIEGGVMETHDFHGKSFAIYPNPASGKVNIRGNREIENIQVYDLLGNLVYSQENLSQKNTEIPTHNFEQGLYLLKIISPNGKTSTEKLMVSNLP